MSTVNGLCGGIYVILSSAETTCGPAHFLAIPQGLNRVEFDRISARIRVEAGARGLGSDIVVQGSRAAGTARLAGNISDIDIAIRVSPSEFDRIINSRSLTTISRPNPGGSLAATRSQAIENGIIQTGEARLSRLANEIFGTLREIPTQISIVRVGGAFDNGPQIPLAFNFIGR